MSVYGTETLPLKLKEQMKQLVKKARILVSQTAGFKTIGVFLAGKCLQKKKKYKSYHLIQPG
jgi:hypothetical protein